jgi:hypothetical protein
MQCPECRFDNPAGINFCGQCGIKLINFCPGCHNSNPAQFRFCGNCGRDLGIPSAAGLIDISFEDKIKKIQRYMPKGLAEKVLLQKERIEGERRQITVMFCDMEGFTQFSEELCHRRSLPHHGSDLRKSDS